MQGKRILVVEDDRITALDVQNGLKRLGYEISAVVARGEDAVERAGGVDAVLMDIYLEGRMDGIEAARLIRKRHDIPVVFLTVLSDVETLERALSIEPFGYIVKPFESAALRSALEIALFKHAIERDLRSSEARFRAVAEAAPVCVLTLRSGAVDSASRHCREELGLDLSDDYGRSFAEILHPDFRHLAAEVESVCMRRGAELRSELLTAGSDGRTGRWLDMVFRPVDHDGERHVIGAGVDVTAAHKAEEELGVLRALLDSDPQAVICVDAERKIVFANRAARRLLAREPESLAGASLDDLGLGDRSLVSMLLADPDRRAVLTLTGSQGVSLPAEIACHPFEHSGRAFGCLRLTPLAGNA